MDFDPKDWPIECKKLEDLKPASYNPRIISDKSFDGLGESIFRFGLLIPIVWNKRTGNIVGGHQRYRHLVESGDSETDVVVVDLDDDDEVALNISLNNPKSRGSFTEDVVERLNEVSGSLGDVFEELRLGTLRQQLTKHENKPKIKDDGGGEETPSEISEQVAIITCPECNSRWNMENNEVIFDGRKAMGDTSSQAGQDEATSGESENDNEEGDGFAQA